MQKWERANVPLVVGVPQFENQHSVMFFSFCVLVLTTSSSVSSRFSLQWKAALLLVFFVFYLFKAPDRGSAVLAVQIHSSQAVIHWIHLHTQTLTVSVKSNWLELRPTDRGKSPRGRRHFAASPRDHWFFTLLLVITDDAGHKSGDHGGPGCPDWPDREWEIGNRDITAGKRDA